MTKADLSSATSTPATAFWRAAYAQSGGRLPRLTSDAAEEAFWQEHASSYDQVSPLASCAHAMIEDLRALIGKNWHLLEIGAGSGAFTRQLKSGLSRLTIVEPSAAMRAEFQRHWDGPDILEVLPCKWEEAPEVRVDMVFGANAFYRINDIAAALSKMNKLAHSRVALVQTVGRPYANPLTVTTDGVCRERERADALCDVLDELHIDHRRRDYEVLRPDGPSKAALIDWVPA